MRNDRWTHAASHLIRFSSSWLAVGLFLTGSLALAEDKPYEVGDDFQATIEIVHANRQIHLGDFLHVMDVHGQQLGLVRVSRFDSDACVARVVEGTAPKGSTLLRDVQMSADRNRRSHVREIASVDSDADRVGAKRRDEGAVQESSVDGEVTGWRAWSPIKSMKMRKMFFLALTPSNVMITSSNATPKFNYGFGIGAVAEFMKDTTGFEVGLEYYQAGTNEADSTSSVKYTFSYLGIPILYKYSVRASEENEWHIKGGLTQSFLLSKNLAMGGLASSGDGSFSMNSLDTLLTIGTDYLFISQNPESFNYWAQLTFSYGLTSLGLGKQTSHSELFNIGVGLFF